METLTILGAALGLAALSGINLYATVAITGLAVRLGWVALPDELMGLDVLGSWLVVGLAGGMYLVEFVADKWPWLDNIWDMAHTFIRPPAAALVALAATAETADPVIQVMAVLLAGGVALGAHATKSTTRLAMNAASPEPTKNVLMSLAEDAVVAGSVLFVMTHPILSLAILVVLVALAIWLGPKMLRLLAVQLRGLVHAARYLWNRGRPVHWEAPPARYLGGLDRGSILATIPCYSLGLKKIGRYRNGYLVLTDRRELVFLTRKWFRPARVSFTNVEIETMDLRLGRIFRTLSLRTVSGKASFKLYRNEPGHIERQLDEIQDVLEGTELRVARPGRSRVSEAVSRIREAVRSVAEPVMDMP